MRTNWVAVGAGALLAVVVAGALHGPDAGGEFDSDPSVRVDQLVNQSEGYGPIGAFRSPWWEGWGRTFWPWLFEPSHLTPERLRGGTL